jgi:AraC family transcriptional regulator
MNGRRRFGGVERSSPRMRLRSEAEYQKRLHAVLEHIDRHLDETLDLATLAAVAHFSAFHFHRLFRALTGEPIGDYIRRRRIELAAMRLRSQPDVPVLEIALGVGFGSNEAFARAFRARFGCTPTTWRKSKHDQLARKAGQAPRFDRSKNGGKSRKETAMKSPLKVRLVDREPVHVAYLRYSGPVGAAIGTFWMATVAPWMGTNNLYGRDRYGISLDDPSVTRDANIRYDACVASPEGEVLTGSPQRKVIPGGRYAAMSFEGTGAEIGAAWDALLRDWLPKSGMQLDSRPFFEHYPPTGDYDPKTGAFSCDLCVPVAPL